MDYIIGGRARLGQGWKMLMTALAAGRGISLPSLSAAGAAYAARTTGAYARIREQFNVPIGKFEGVQEPLARIAGTAYLLDAARRLTCAALNQGHHPAVISGIMKLHATERMRIAIDDAMDIHGGKAGDRRPQNYMGHLYRSVPVGITGRGRQHSHPQPDRVRAGCDPRASLSAGRDERARRSGPRQGLDAFDKAFWKHIGHSVTTLFRAWGRSWTGGCLRRRPMPERRPNSIASFRATRRRSRCAPTWRC
jgi:acyl-CoA dehydrogenase